MKKYRLLFLLSAPYCFSLEPVVTKYVYSDPEKVKVVILCPGQRRIALVTSETKKAENSSG